MDRAKQNYGFVCWASCIASFLALTGCKTEEPDWIELEISSFGMWSSVASRIGRVEIWLDETGWASPFSAPSEMVTGTLPGAGVVKAQIRDVEGDGKNELWFEFQTNPFDWDRLIVPIYSDHNYAAGTFNIRVAERVNNFETAGFHNY